MLLPACFVKLDISAMELEILGLTVWNAIIILSTCPINVGFGPEVPGSSFCITINISMIQKLFNMQKLGPGTARLKPSEFGHVGKVNKAVNN